MKTQSSPLKWVLLLMIAPLLLLGCKKKIDPATCKLASINYPDWEINTTFTYDEKGRVRMMSEIFSGQNLVTFFTYDANDRVYQLAGADQVPDQTISYVDDKIDKVIADAYDIQCVYNSGGNLTERKYTYKEKVKQTISRIVYKYDDANNMVQSETYKTDDSNVEWLAQKVVYENFDDKIKAKETVSDYVYGFHKNNPRRITTWERNESTLPLIKTVKNYSYSYNDAGLVTGKKVGLLLGNYDYACN